MWEQSSTANWTVSYFVIAKKKKDKKKQTKFCYWIVCKFYLAILSALLTLSFLVALCNLLGRVVVSYITTLLQASISLLDSI